MARIFSAGNAQSAAPPPAGVQPHVSGGRLERVLRRGEFAVTAELDPPDSADPQDVFDRAILFEGWVDAINATDGSGANCHMSSVAMCALLTRIGYEPILQISCRDYNRIAIQGNVLGAAAMGVPNVLCLTGDGVQAGDHPEAKPVFDLDSTSLLTARWMRAHVPGVYIPDGVIARLEGAQDQRAEGRRLCIEIQQVRDIPAVAGVHVMAYRQGQHVAEIVHDSGVLKGRVSAPPEFHDGPRNNAQ